MTNELSNIPFDFIINGTELFESIIACALSKADLKVLQLDSNSYYGSNEASLSLSSSSIEFNSTFIKFESIDTKLNNKTPIDFNLDLSPKFLFSNCQLTRELCSSGIAEYLEFKPINSIFYYWNNEFIKVPLKKEDLFTSKSFSLIEKRLMMKVIESLQQDQNINSIENYLNEISNEKISGIIKSCFEIGKLQYNNEFIKKFVSSCNIFSPSPFLYCSFGSSELLQGFIRLSAVNGAIQILSSADFLDASCNDEPVKKDQDSCYYSFFKNNQPVVKGKNLITKKYSSNEFLYKRFILSNSPLLPDQFSLGYVGREDGGGSVIRIFQSYFQSTNNSYYFIYFESETEFEREFDCLSTNITPIAIASWKSPKWCEYFLNENSLGIIENCIDYDYYLGQAHKVFKQLYPTLQFLTSPPL